MKKLLTATAILALSFATIAEAKRGGMSRMTVAKPAQSVQSNTATTNVFGQRVEPAAPKVAAPNMATNSASQMNMQARAAGGSRLSSLATGALAGYVIGGMLTPDAQAAVNEAVANGVVQEFKPIGGDVNPYLVEQTDAFSRYCLNGVQYFAPKGSQPVALTAQDGKPLQCKLVP